MYNMTGIAKFYNKFLSFIELDPTRPTHICKFSDPARPDPTRPAGRPDPRATLLRGNALGSFVARWNARCGLPISDN